MHLRLILPALILVTLAGCSEGPVKPANVDPSLARESLKTVLETWKKGEKPAKLASSSPAIVVQDMDWEAGSTLTAYQIEGEGKSDTANLLVPVNVTVRDKKGKETKKTVTYIVSTSPTITVFRDIFP